MVSLERSRLEAFPRALPRAHLGAECHSLTQLLGHVVQSMMTEVFEASILLFSRKHMAEVSLTDESLTSTHPSSNPSCSIHFSFQRLISLLDLSF